MTDRKLLLGNEAIAYGLLENGCAMAASYPGTPASEILASLAALKSGGPPHLHVQWAVNEKIAFEIAYAGCMTGLRTAAAMKQVGLNVASDPFMSAAYLGTLGGFVVISADDPGPHSSQTEQDSRMVALTAKVPVLDPASPRQAKEMVGLGFELSEAFTVPVLLRPTTRVCHARQDIALGRIETRADRPCFEKDPARWAATPKFRYHLHQALAQKLERIAAYPDTAPVRCNPEAAGSRAVVASGVAAAHGREILRDLNLLSQLPFYQVLQPFPLHTAFITHLLNAYEEILVLEETLPVIEMQIAQRRQVRGRMSGAVAPAGELLPEIVQSAVAKFAGVSGTVQPVPSMPGRRPTLCAGCPHRASFFAIRKAAPKGIYPSDIGCYTLGLNFGAVDTVLCMGAAVSQAAGFYHAFKHTPDPPPIVATIGDSTFFHAGIPALVDAVVQDARFVLVVLDNQTTAMTGNQPTPATGTGAAGEPTRKVDIEALVRGCGVDFCRIADPYQVPELIALLKEAAAYSRQKGPAVVIARRPCLLDKRCRSAAPGGRVTLAVTEDCDGCGYCADHFECPALVLDREAGRAFVDPLRCSGCGVCRFVCPKGAVREIQAAVE